MRDLYLEPPDGPPVYLGRGEVDETDGTATLAMDTMDAEVEP